MRSTKPYGSPRSWLNRLRRGCARWCLVSGSSSSDNNSINAARVPLRLLGRRRNESGLSLWFDLCSPLLQELADMLPVCRLAGSKLSAGTLGARRRGGLSRCDGAPIIYLVFRVASLGLLLVVNLFFFFLFSFHKTVGLGGIRSQFQRLGPAFATLGRGRGQAEIQGEAHWMGRCGRLQLQRG